MNADAIADQELLDLLAAADPADLGLLADYLTDNGAGRISMSSDICQLLTDAKNAGSFAPPITRVMAAEICRFGGNTLVNLFRGGRGVSYRTIVQDVASHLKIEVSEHDSVAQMENAIIARFAEQAWTRMTASERGDMLTTLGMPAGVGPATLAAMLGAVRLGGPAAYGATMLIANSVAQTLAGRGLAAVGANVVGGRAIAALAGPIGWVLTAIWTLYDLASPAFRITVPCVVQIAYMRGKV
jgi:uncharacterized protein YaaW (UPF0174 family)